MKWKNYVSKWDKRFKQAFKDDKTPNFEIIFWLNYCIDDGVMKQYFYSKLEYTDMKETDVVSIKQNN